MKEEFCKRCGKHTLGGHERDSTDLCWCPDGGDLADTHDLCPRVQKHSGEPCGNLKNKKDQYCTDCATEQSK